jgi:hypothetical protein
MTEKLQTFPTKNKDFCSSDATEDARISQHLLPTIQFNAVLSRQLAI